MDVFVEIIKSHHSFELSDYNLHLPEVPIVSCTSLNTRGESVAMTNPMYCCGFRIVQHSPVSLYPPPLSPLPKHEEGFCDKIPPGLLAEMCQFGKILLESK